MVGNANFRNSFPSARRCTETAESIRRMVDCFITKPERGYLAAARILRDFPEPESLVLIFPNYLLRHRLLGKCFRRKPLASHRSWQCNGSVFEGSKTSPHCHPIRQARRRAARTTSWARIFACLGWASFIQAFGSVLNTHREFGRKITQNTMVYCPTAGIWMRLPIGRLGWLGMRHR